MPLRNTAIKLVDKDGNEPSGLVYDTTPIPENAINSHQYTQGTSTTIGGSVNGGFTADDREPGLAAEGTQSLQLGSLFHQERIYRCRDGKHQILQDGRKIPWLSMSCHTTRATMH